MICPHCAGADTYLDSRYPEVQNSSLLIVAACENCGSTWRVAYIPFSVLDLCIGKSCQCDVCKYKRSQHGNAILPSISG